MQRNAWKYCALANKITQQLYKVAIALATAKSKKKNWDLLENCLKCAHRLSSNAYTWLVLADFLKLSEQIGKISHKMDSSL